MEESSSIPTYGEKAVGVSFNPSQNQDVAEAKATLAKAIDQMNDLRTKAFSGEQKRLASVIRLGEVAEPEVK